MKLKFSLRIWILIIALLFSLLAINPTLKTGIYISSIETNSTAFEQGLRQGETIKTINGQIVEDKETYTKIISQLFSDNEEKRVDIVTNKDEYTLLISEPPKITVDKISRTKIQMGLDLRGGARALVQPDEQITDSELNDLVEISRNRFNAYGLSDVNVKGVSDLSGNKFLLIEIAGATPQDLEQLVAQQGKFEAKVGNETVFVGGQDKDVRDVCRNDATCAAVTSCFAVQNGQACSFQFTVYLSEKAAQRHADITENLSLDETGQYLSEKLYLYVDEKEVDSLLISSGLRGQTTTQISIQGSGNGATREEALLDAKASMKKLQTILLTGSLPYKLNIVRLDTLSPNLGSDFIRAILMAGLIAIIAVSIIVFVRYRNFKASLALLLISFSEIVIILGIASFIKWNLDLPSIAGILATIGTGVDQQIVILDEAKKGRTLSIKERMKRALFVIVSSYFTSVVSLLPLWWAGAGLFKGFALTTIIGITTGVLITRPAFADIIKRIEA